MLLKVILRIAYICADRQWMIYILMKHKESVKVFFLSEWKRHKDCVAPCRSCFAADSKSCSSCLNNWVLYGTECLKSCPDKHYVDSGVCLPCDQNCKACIGKTNFCINGCEDPYVFKDNKCIEDCGEGYTKNNGKCEPCDKGCASCKYEGILKKCLTCDENKFMINNTCTDKCLQGQFENIETGLCEFCSKECKECFGNTFHDCYSCNKKEGYIMISDNTCMLPTCTIGFFYNTTVSECQNCPNECSECDNFQNCTNCQRGYAYDYSNKKCFNPCNRIGFTKKEGTYDQCTEICGDARNMKILECDDGNIQDGDGCSKDCKIEEYYECSGGDFEHADICINRKPLEIASFKYYGNRTAVLVFAARAQLLEFAKASKIKFKEMVEFSVETENGDKGVDWSYSDFNEANFKKVIFQLKLNFSLNGDEVFFSILTNFKKNIKLHFIKQHMIVDMNGNFIHKEIVKAKAFRFKYVSDADKNGATGAGSVSLYTMLTSLGISLGLSLVLYFFYLAKF